MGLWRSPPKLRLVGQAITLDERHLGKMIGQNTGHGQASNTAADNHSVAEGRSTMLIGMSC
jgi:hypothetical protein